MTSSRNLQRWGLWVAAVLWLAACAQAPAPATPPVVTPASIAAASATTIPPVPVDTPTSVVASPKVTASLAPTGAASPLPPAVQAPTASATPAPAVAVTATASPTIPPATHTVAPSAAPAVVVAPSASLSPATASVPTRVTPSTDPHPLQIAVMRQQSYPGSEIVVERSLAPGPNYDQAVVSYQSDGLKIYALMTVPHGQRPTSGWPVVIFNHGYISPSVYRTTERYVAYVAAFARSGYIVLKSDYRGHGSSEGRAAGGYASPDYTVDVLNAVAAVKAYKDADPNRIGMWGHSMGGQLTLRAMVVSPDIRAGVIWGGVVAPYPDTFARGANLRGNESQAAGPVPGASEERRTNWRSELAQKYGTVQQNPAFYASISPNSYLADLSGPIQLHHSTTDESVPVASSRTLFAEGQAANLPIELFIYAGDNHNINANFNIAMQRSIAFFDQHVKER